MLYELPVFEHSDAKSLEEAVSLLRQNGEKAKVIAGGTDLLSFMKDRVEGPALKTPKVLINIKTIPEMGRIAEDHKAGGLRIGAAVTLSQLDASGAIQQKLSILCQAVQQVGTTQLRNMGTVGGNLCQRLRCLYFRHPHFPCYKKGGDRCYAAAGEHRHYHSILKNGRCTAACPSDLAPALVALGARAILMGEGGEKALPLQDFFLGPNHFTEIVLKPDEFLAAVQVPEERRTHQVFLKHRIRHATDFALASVAMVANVSEGVLEKVRIVLGGVAPFPYVASAAEALLVGNRLDGALISKAAEAAVEGAKPLPMNRYKINLTQALVRRALTSIS